MIAVKVLDSSGNGYASDVLAGLSWIRRQKERLGIRIVNISVGSYAGKYMSEDSASVRGVEAAWDDGLVVVVAAGNHGPANMSVTTPGISRKVITVGCSDDYKNKKTIPGLLPFVSSFSISAFLLFMFNDQNHRHPLPDNQNHCHHHRSAYNPVP